MWEGDIFAQLVLIIHLPVPHDVTHEVDNHHSWRGFLEELQLR